MAIGVDAKTVGQDGILSPGEGCRGEKNGYGQPLTDNKKALRHACGNIHFKLEPN